jgi:hypothetical protein
MSPEIVLAVDSGLQYPCGPDTFSRYDRQPTQGMTLENRLSNANGAVAGPPLNVVGLWKIKKSIYAARV